MPGGSLEGDAEYPINDKGLFVIIVNSSFNGKQTLNFEPSLNKLSDMFNLKDRDGHYLPNVKFGPNLGSKPPNILFEDFMDSVIEYKKNALPSFVMFFLMSHGLDDNTFMLAGGNDDSLLLIEDGRFLMIAGG